MRRDWKAEWFIVLLIDAGYVSGLTFTEMANALGLSKGIVAHIVRHHVRGVRDARNYIPVRWTTYGLTRRRQQKGRAAKPSLPCNPQSLRP